MHRANEIRPVMSHLASIAEKYGCAVLLIGHMNKAMGMKSTYRGLGSIDITAAARSVLIVARDKENPSFRVVANAKSSLAPEGKTVAFELDPDSGFHFKGEYECNIDEILLGVGSKSKGKQAMELLQEELKDGEVSQKVISANAKYSRISSRTLNEAKKILGVKSVKRNGQWFWALPKMKTNNYGGSYYE